MDTAFVPQYATLNLGLTTKTGFLIPDINCLNEHLDASLKVIYSFPDRFTHELKLQNIYNLKMYIHYHQSSYLNHSNFEFDVKNMYDNPLRKLGDNSNIRVNYFIYYKYKNNSY